MPGKIDKKRKNKEVHKKKSALFNRQKEDDEAYVSFDTQLKKKKKKEEELPEKPQTPYFLFMKVNKAGVMADNPNLTFGSLTKKLTEMWKALDEDDRADYEELAVKDKKRYYDEMEKRAKRKYSEAIKTFVPKRPVSPFVHFSYEARARIKKVNDQIERTEMIKRLAIEWGELRESEKHRWRVLNR